MKFVEGLLWIRSVREYCGWDLWRLVLWVKSVEGVLWMRSAEWALCVLISRSFEGALWIRGFVQGALWMGSVNGILWMSRSSLWMKCLSGALDELACWRSTVNKVCQLSTVDELVCWGSTVDELVCWGDWIKSVNGALWMSRSVEHCGCLSVEHWG